MKNTYCLEVFSPGSRVEVLGTLFLNHPFGAIAKGDLINTTLLPGGSLSSTVRALEIEHIVWEAAGLTYHKVCVYTANE